MSETLRLLKYDPAEALLIMANNHLNLNLRPEFAKVTNVTSLGGVETEVTIETFESTSDFVRRDYTGSIVIQYKRIRVEDVFGRPAFWLKPPITVRTILDIMTRNSGIVITDDDFENERIDGTTFVLKAKPESLRWVGQTTITLNEIASALKLSDAFPNNILNGLWGPEFEQGIYLPNVITETALDGLVYEISSARIIRL